MPKVEIVCKKELFDSAKVIVHRTEAPGDEAEFAMRLMGHIAIAAGHPDGEDAGGRQKLRLLTPEEVAKRACEIASHSFTEFRARGWMIDFPSSDEIEARAAEHEAVQIKARDEKREREDQERAARRAQKALPVSQG